MEPTITVTNSFGRDKQVTKTEFVKIWSDEVKQFWRLAYSSDWMNRVQSFMDDVAAQARIEFDELYERQNKEA